MKKTFLYSFVASVSLISIGAYADPVDASSSALTTKGYVDAGLKYVYDVANGTTDGPMKDLQDSLSDGNGGLINVGDLKDTVGTAGVGGNPGTGLTGAVEDLQGSIGNTAMGTTAETITGAISELNSAIDDLESASQVYDPGEGIKVTAGANPGDASTIGLALPSNPTAGSYVYKIDASGEGTWQALEVENSWNPGFLTTP